MAPAPSSSFAVNLQDVLAAANTIAPFIRCTPVIAAENFPDCTAARLWLKCENLQVGAAFKARGATNAVLSLPDAAAACGVVTHSSGNHAAALARAAISRGIAAHIVMPTNSAAVKLAAVRGLGIEPLLCEPTAAAREATAADVQSRTGATLVHPFNDTAVIAGQGTAALEIIEQIPEFDTLIVPVGGGGLLAGTLIAIRELCPSIRVIGAEPEWADDARRSLQSVRIEPALRTDSIADGLRTPLGSLTFPIIHALVDDILCASELLIRHCVADLAACCRIIAEPSGVVPLAVLRQHSQLFSGRKVVALISGGNLDDPALLVPAWNSR